MGTSINRRQSWPPRSGDIYVPSYHYEAPDGFNHFGDGMTDEQFKESMEFAKDLGTWLLPQLKARREALVTGAASEESLAQSLVDKIEELRIKPA